MAEQKAEFDKAMEEQNKAMKENKKILDEMYKEVSTIEKVLRQSRLQSRRVSAVPSSLSSRVPSPTDSIRERLDQAKQRLQRELRTKKLKKKTTGHHK